MVQKGNIGWIWVIQFISDRFILITGGENVLVWEAMEELRDKHRRSYITGWSTRNQRIERLWRDVWSTCVTSFITLSKGSRSVLNHSFFERNPFVNLMETWYVLRKTPHIFQRTFLVALYSSKVGGGWGWEGGGVTIGIHLHTMDKCTLKSHGLFFGVKMKNCMGLYPGRLINREMIVLGVHGFAWDIVCSKKRGII